MTVDTNSAPSVYFTLTTDTGVSTAKYVDLYFVNQHSDTITQYGWSSGSLPSILNEQQDSISYSFPYKAGITSFPTDFDGYLVTKNPDCEIPFNYQEFLSVDNIELEKKIKIYPNPAIENIIVETSGLSLTTPKLYTLQGKEVKLNYSSKNRGYTIDTSGLSSGTYLLQLQNLQGETLTKKLVVE